MTDDDSHSNPWAKYGGPGPSAAEEPASESSGSPGGQPYPPQGQSASPYGQPPHQQGHGAPHGQGYPPGGGQYYSPPNAYAPPGGGSASGMAIGALVTGIFGFLSGSFVMCCGLLGSIISIPVALTAIILSYVEWTKINRGQSPQQGKVMVMIGGVLGGLTMAWNLLVGGLILLIILAG